MIRESGVELVASNVCCDTRGLNVVLRGLSPPERCFEYVLLCFSPPNPDRCFEIVKSRPASAAKSEYERKAVGRTMRADRARFIACPLSLPTAVDIMSVE
jgi:hypothetical protein